MSGKFPDPIGSGALWEKETKTGGTYLSGVLEFSSSPGAPPIKVQFAAFSAMKKSDASPDYKIVVNSCGPAPARNVGAPRADRPMAGQAPAHSSQAPAHSSQAPAHSSQAEDEEMPF